MSGLYVHIPFCKTRCIYCSFCSTTRDEWQESYVDAAAREMAYRQGETAVCGDIRTVYIGGGTPSVLPHPLLRRLFSGIRSRMLGGKGFGEMEEVTMECNPDDVTEELAALLRDEGVGRVSLGVQTFCDRRLQFIRRRHNARQVVEAVDTLRRAGIDNISIDLIYGFPQQTQDDWAQDIDQAIRLGVPHVSAYCLSYEENTPLWTMKEQGTVEEADDEHCRNMYYQLIDRLTDAGYIHYEISNFALSLKHARHNSSYWNDTHYIGIGAAAHSYLPDKRRWNTDDIGHYISHTLHGHTPYEAEVIDRITHFNDLITTAMRTREGLSVERLREIFPQSYVDGMLHEAQRHIESGMLRIDNGRLHLTREALFTSDSILSDLIRV